MINIAVVGCTGKLGSAIAKSIPKLNICSVRGGGGRLDVWKKCRPVRNG